MSAPNDPLESLQSQVDELNRYIALGRQLAQQDFHRLLQAEAQKLLDESFRHRNLGQLGAAKVMEETSSYLLSLISSLPPSTGAR